MLDKTKFHTMLAMQDETNSVVNKDWLNAGNKWMRAIMVEAVEALEHMGWKWWKKQEPDLPQARMEMVDIWHFALSVYLEARDIMEGGQDAIDNILESTKAGLVDVSSGGFVYPADQDVRDDIQLMATMAGQGIFSTELFNNIIQKLDFSWDDLYEVYVSKGVLNQFRQRNGYKSGEYIKNWSFVELKNIQVSGRDLEDNDHLHDVMQEIDPASEDYPSQLLAALTERYKAVQDSATHDWMK